MSGYPTQSHLEESSLHKEAHLHLSNSPASLTEGLHFPFWVSQTLHLQFLGNAKHCPSSRSCTCCFLSVHLLLLSTLLDLLTQLLPLQVMDTLVLSISPGALRGKLKHIGPQINKGDSFEQYIIYTISFRFEHDVYEHIVKSTVSWWKYSELQ